MNVSVNLYSENTYELNRFLSKFYNSNFDLKNELKWRKKYRNPIELAEIIGVFSDNFDDFNLSMWISIDKNVFIKITSENSDKIIRYLYERFPY